MDFKYDILVVSQKCIAKKNLHLQLVVPRTGKNDELDGPDELEWIRGTCRLSLKMGRGNVQKMFQY